MEQVEIQRLQGRITQLHADIHQIQGRRSLQEKERSGDPAMLQLRQAQQMYSMVVKRKSEIMSRLERLKEKRQALGGRSSETEEGFGGSGDKGVDEEQWRERYDRVKAQMPKYVASFNLRLFPLICRSINNSKPTPILLLGNAQLKQLT